ncbi:hypothetical protein [Jatrophihabitans sp. GAS493]|uniref:hypothetical protein n=1 Tax=Jatrophihabitans sp. GAS493 TaxID=1907575 RepID=UPI0012FDE229|nr:hypothetical protein [Jatrophihabitans sp. GAS493]
MPESRADQRRRTNEEVSNYVECGDARGPGWLQTHPHAQARAAEELEKTHAAQLPRH